MSNKRIPYPPCAGRPCPYNTGSYKTAWPELVGHWGADCETRIKNENPFVNVVYVPRNGGTIDTQYCCNRVYLFVDEANNCYFTPTVG
ncbi:hypothetical protein C2S52_020367 [Perilla frutescens var. hirtella]|nr:hypothetical protein C2S52_020367 [Perilla frutescens var. hirtella]KAH6805576.1 hypothetical protein C2S51_030407 [Perilla frutescens var. frutescens]